MSDDLERAYLVAVSSAAAMAPRPIAAWYAALGSATAIVDRHRRGACGPPDGVRALPPAVAAGVSAIDEATARAAVAAAAHAGISIACLGDAQYPARLRDLHDAPLALYYRGALSAIGERTVAIVGSRAASAYGRTVATAFAGTAAAYGAAVISGLARGIDAAAHRAALGAGTPTVAVLGSGLAAVFPSYHAALAAEIVAAGGAVISEFAPAVRAQARFFPQRNRLVAALADATVAVEADTRSGALITVRLADELGRPVFAVPGDVDRPTSRGTNALIRDGVAPATGMADVAEWLRWEPAAAPQSSAAAGGADPIVAALRERPLDADELGARSRLGAPAVAAHLALLEIAGVVRRDGARYALTDARATTAKSGS